MEVVSRINGLPYTVDDQEGVGREYIRVRDPRTGAIEVWRRSGVETPPKQTRMERRVSKLSPEQASELLRRIADAAP